MDALLGIGELFGGLARGATAGVQLNQNQQRIELAKQSEARQQKIAEETLSINRDTLKMKRDQLLMQIRDMQLVGEMAQGISAGVEGNEQVNQFMTTAKGLAGMPTGIRAPLVDQYATAFREQTGKDLAPAVVAVLKKGKPEELTGIFAAMEEQIAGDPDMNPEKLAALLSDPMAAGQAIMELSANAKRMADRAAVTSPEVMSGDLMKRKTQAEITRIERQIAAIDQRLPMISSKAGLEKALSLKNTLTTQLNNLNTQLRQDTTETLDLGDRIEERDKVSGEVIRTIFKNAAPAAGSNRLFNVVGPEGQVLGRAVFNSQSNRAVMEGTGEPVPAGAQLQGIGSGGMAIEVGKDGTVRVATGPGATNAVRTDLQQGVISAEQFALDVEELLSRLRAEDVGVWGNATELFQNKLLAQVRPEWGDADVASNRTKLRQIGETAVKVFGAPPFSNADRDAAKRLVASEGWLTSVVEARATLGMVAQIAKERASYAAGQLGRKTLTDMSPEEIKAAVKAGKLDQRTALRALEYLHPDFLMKGGTGDGKK